jgi:hypothetical protein
MPTATYDQSNITYNSAVTDYDGDDVGVTNMPVVGVFVAFNDAPYTAEPAWTEITQYVRNMNIRRGRDNDTQQFPSGSATITLDNRARLFDPFNTAGTYYGQLKPRRQIKIVAQYAGVTYPVFRGFIAGFPVSATNGGKDSTVTIDCFDVTTLLSVEVNKLDNYNTTVSSLSPVYYWTFSELPPAYTGVNVVLTSIGSRTTSMTLNMNKQNVAVPSNNIEQPFFVGQFPQDISLAGTYSDRTGDLTISFIYKTYSGTAKYVGGTMYFWGNSIGNFLQIYQSGTVSGYKFVASVGGASTLSTKVVADDIAHHIAVTYNNTTGLLRIYVDGEDVSTSQVASAGQATPDVLRQWTYVDTVVLPAANVYPQFDYGEQGINNLAIFHRELSISEIDRLSANSVDAVVETALLRYQRIMSYSSFSNSLVIYPDYTTSTVYAFPLADLSTFTMLQQTADGEGGEVYVDSSGRVILTNREFFALPRSAISNVTFTDTGTGVYYDYREVRMGFDADVIRNSINVTSTLSTELAYEDAGSIAENGVANDSVNTTLKDKTEVDSFANRYLTINKNTKLQIEQFLVKGQRNPTYDWSRLLSLELLDRFTFVRTPSVGSAISQEMLLQSIEHNITPNTWETMVNGTARYTGWFVIGVSLIGGTDVLL